MPQLYIIILFGLGGIINLDRLFLFLLRKNYKAAAIVGGQIVFLFFNMFVLYAGGFFHPL